MFFVVFCRWEVFVCVEIGLDGCEGIDEISGRRGYFKVCKLVLFILIFF